MKNLFIKTIGARVTEELHEELTRVAQKQDRTKAEILRELAERYIRRYEEDRES